MAGYQIVSSFVFSVPSPPDTRLLSGLPSPLVPVLIYDYRPLLQHVQFRHKILPDFFQKIVNLVIMALLLEIALPVAHTCLVFWEEGSQPNGQILTP